MKAYGVFEGGGARGYAHVGALRAAERRDIEFIAVAGTSIGAAIAALIAAGYRSNDLLRIEDGNERGLLAEDLTTKLLNSAEYRRIMRWRSQRLWFAEGRFLRSADRLWRHLYAVWWLLIVPAIFLSPVAFLFHGRLLRAIWSQSGATGTELFREWFGEKLRAKLDLPEGEKVRFRHLRQIQLRVIAADLTTSQIRVFGGEEDADMDVTEAVSASISYPLFFRPARIGESVFVDGGMVSNFPAWALDDVRDLQPRAYPTFGFRLIDGSATEAVAAWPGDTPPLAMATIARLMATALDSRQSLESRRIDDYHPISLPTHIRTLDFHLLSSERARLIRHGEEGVESYFRKQIGPQPLRKMELALRSFANVLAEALQNSNFVRSYLLQRSDKQTCRVVYAALMEGDADDMLQLRWDSSSQALSLRLKEPVLLRVSDISDLDRTRPTTKYMHALRPASVKHVYCVPIFREASEWSRNPLERADPIAAFCIDFAEGDDRLLLDPEIEDLASAVAQAFGEFWVPDQILTQIPAAQDVVPAGADWRSIPGATGFYVSDRKFRLPVSEERQRELDQAVVQADERWKQET